MARKKFGDALGAMVKSDEFHGALDKVKCMTEAYEQEPRNKRIIDPPLLDRFSW